MAWEESSDVEVCDDDLYMYGYHGGRDIESLETHLLPRSASRRSPLSGRSSKVRVLFSLVQPGPTWFGDRG